MWRDEEIKKERREIKNERRSRCEDRKKKQNEAAHVKKETKNGWKEDALDFDAIIQATGSVTHMFY